MMINERASISGLLAQQRAMDTAANNIANMDTVGYKRTRNEIRDGSYRDVELLAIQSDGTPAATPVSFHLGSGVADAVSHRFFEQGTLEQTGRDLDVAIDGTASCPSGSTPTAWLTRGTARSRWTAKGIWSRPPACLSTHRSRCPMARRSSPSARTGP